MFIKKLVSLFVVLFVVNAATIVFAQQSSLDTLSIDEISRKLENPLSNLWSLTIQENYFLDSAESIVLYFLSNAQTWRGEVARRIKKELKEMLKEV